MDDKVSSHHKSKRRKVIRRICGGLLLLNFILLPIFLLLCGFLQPRKPLFLLQNVTVFTFKVSADYAMSTAINATIISTNPNSKIGIYYGNLNVYATYNNQRITNDTVIPRLYQPQKAQNVWSPFISGGMVQVKDLYSLDRDNNDSVFSITVQIHGSIKWNLASVVSGRYHIHVSCPANISLTKPKLTGGHGKPGGKNRLSDAGVKHGLSESCGVVI